MVVQMRKSIVSLVDGLQAQSGVNLCRYFDYAQQLSNLSLYHSFIYCGARQSGHGGLVALRSGT